MTTQLTRRAALCAAPAALALPTAARAAADPANVQHLTRIEVLFEEWWANRVEYDTVEYPGLSFQEEDAIGERHLAIQRKLEDEIKELPVEKMRDLVIKVLIGSDAGDLGASQFDDDMQKMILELALGREGFREHQRRYEAQGTKLLG